MRDEAIAVAGGLHGCADLTVTADGDTWVRYLRGETGLLCALLSRRLRIEGPLRLMKAFSRCFPG